jgi:hypothetical protein
MFRVGDIAIANERAKGVYSITKPGWIGTVIRVYPGFITVAGKEGNFTVCSEHFDLYKDPLDIKDISRLI